VTLYHKIGFGARLANYCFVCFLETRCVFFRLKDMGVNCGDRGVGWWETCCPVGGSENREGVQEVNVGKLLPIL